MIFSSSQIMTCSPLSEFIPKNYIPLVTLQVELFSSFHVKVQLFDTQSLRLC
jgi:hypothetical protein